MAQKYRSVNLYLNTVEDADLVELVETEARKTKRLKGRIVKSFLRELIQLRIKASVNQDKGAE